MQLKETVQPDGLEDPAHRLAGPRRPAVGRGALRQVAGEEGARGALAVPTQAGRGPP